MNMQTYRYSGPVSGATLAINGKELDVRLHPGKTVQLPDSHEYTQTLLGLGYLTVVQAAPDAVQEAAQQPPQQPQPGGTDAPAPGKPRGKGAKP